MRDVGILIWVGLLIIGVVGSMVSSLRRQAQALAQRPSAAPRPQPQPEWLERAVAQMPPGARVVQVVRPPKPVAPVTGAPPSPAPSAPKVRVTDNAPVGFRPMPEHEATKGRRFFGGRGGLVRAVIAAEVLGKPRALSDEYFRG